MSLGRIERPLSQERKVRGTDDPSIPASDPLSPLRGGVAAEKSGDSYRLDGSQSRPMSFQQVLGVGKTLPAPATFLVPSENLLGIPQLVTYRRRTNYTLP